MPATPRGAARGLTAHCRAPSEKAPGKGVLLSLEEKQDVDKCNAKKVCFFTVI